jgi:hypothetical protein
VRVWCDPNRQILTSILRRESPSTSSCTWVELCEWLAPALDVDLSVEVDGEIRWAVRANDWLLIDAETMLLRLNRKSSEHATAAILQRRGDWPTVTSYLGIIRDESDRPIARGTVWTPDPEQFRNSVTVCGGLRTDAGGNFMGIRFGRPETAARHVAVGSEQMAGWLAWAEEQRQLDDPRRFDVVIRAMAAIRLCPFINPGNMPIGCSHTGWVTLDQFATAIRAVPAFRCIGAPIWVAPVVVQMSAETPCLVVNGHHVLNQLDGRGFTIIQLLRDMAAQQWGCACEVSDLNQGMKHIIVNGQFVGCHTVTFSRGGSPSDLQQ